MRGFQLFGRETGEERCSDEVAHTGPAGPGRFLCGKAERFKEEARNDDEGERPDQHRETGRGFKRHTLFDPAGPDGDPEARECRKSGKVEDQFVEEVEVSLKDPEAEEQTGDVPVNRGERCTEEKEDESPEKREMRFSDRCANDPFLHEAFGP